MLNARSFHWPRCGAFFLKLGSFLLPVVLVARSSVQVGHEKGSFKNMNWKHQAQHASNGSNYGRFYQNSLTLFRFFFFFSALRVCFSKFAGDFVFMERGPSKHEKGKSENAVLFHPVLSSFLRCYYWSTCCVHVFFLGYDSSFFWFNSADYSLINHPD